MLCSLLSGELFGHLKRTTPILHDLLSGVPTAMMEKRLFWREFWLLWSTGALAGAVLAALVRIPTTPVAAILLLRGHSQKPLLVGTEAIEITVELAIAVSCGLLAAHRIGLGAPILEKCLRGEAIKSQLRSLLVPTLLVGITVAAASMLPNLSVFQPNRQLAHQEAERISESPDGAKLAEKLERFSDGRPLGLTSLTFSYLNAAIRGELISRLFLFSVIALLLTKITGSPTGTASNRVLFSAVLSVAAIGAIASVAWQSATTKIIYSSVGMVSVVHDSLWLVIARALLRTVPGAVGFGWLYVRRGVESAILSAFVASVVAHLLFVVVAVHLF